MLFTFEVRLKVNNCIFLVNTQIFDISFGACPFSIPRRFIDNFMHWLLPIVHQASEAVLKLAFEFSLNGRGIQWFQRIQGIWEITEAWFRVNIKIVSVTCVFMALWNHLCLLYRRLWVQDSLFLPKKYFRNPVESTEFVYGKLEWHQEWVWNQFLNVNSSFSPCEQYHWNLQYSFWASTLILTLGVYGPLQWYVASICLPA